MSEALLADSPPCPGCGARRFDPGRFFALVGLCAYCFEDENERAAARIRVRTLHPSTRPLPRFPTPHPPGSPGKEEVLAWRLKNNFQLHHPEDATATSSPPDQSPEVCESPDPISPEAYMEGVEMDRSKGKLAWRARPRWRDCRVKLGRFAKYEEAAEAVKQFFIQRWGSWDDSRPWLRKPAALAVVRVIDGWHDLEFPEGVDRDRARRAAAIVLTMEPYEMWVKAERALRRALAQIAE